MKKTLCVCPGDEQEEIDVVSVTPGESSSDVLVTEPLLATLQPLELTDDEYMSAVVTAMHNYCKPPCSQWPPSPHSTTSIPRRNKYLLLSCIRSTNVGPCSQCALSH